MKLVGLISTAVLSLTLGVAAPAFAQEQHDQQDDQKAKPAQTEEKKAQPAAKPAERPAAQQEKDAKPAEKTAQQQDKNVKPEEKNTQERAQQAKPAEKNQRASGNGGGRIPDARFKANFGQQHTFRVTQADYSNHRFQYGGYSFGFVDPWPSNWLYTQNVYVVDINGVYYLCNSSYPGVNLALSVTL
jgi:hypothetical protein